MTSIENDIRAQLFAMQDLEYKAFHCRLMPTVDPELVIGVRIPQLRAYAKSLVGTDAATEFSKILPHKYYEENNLHGFLLETIKDFDTAVQAVDEFLPYIDNWATCDLISPKYFKKHLTELLPYIYKWIASKETYTIRFGIGMLMKFYLDESFDMKYPKLVAGIRSQEYYVNMMIAWYFATALAKQYKAVLPFVENRCLDTWTHNKAIQKAIESRRITEEQKAYLRGLKIK